VFETLVKQGEALEQRTRHVAEATMETARDQATKTVELASGKFDKLEQVFEARVHKSLNRLGVLTSKDVEALSAQVAELADAVRALLAAEKRGTSRPATSTAARKASKPAAKVAKKPVARKAARKVARKASSSYLSRNGRFQAQPSSVGLFFCGSWGGPASAPVATLRRAPA
jgi:poly(hydroxyalkanoate) granule-associated protein